MSEDEERAALKSLVGHVVVRVERHEDPDGQGGDDAVLYLDDGTTVSFSGWGHDWCGLSIEAVEMVDIEACLACGAPHLASRVFGKMAYCADGNRTGWRR